MKDWKNITIVLLVAALGGILIYYSRRTCFDLPRNPDPSVFGSKYWLALHKIVESIPCPFCREDGVKLMIFMHDFVNLKLKKNLYDPENFYSMLDKFNELKKQIK